MADSNPNQTIIIRGSCFCGKVRYQFRGEPATKVCFLVFPPSQLPLFLSQPLFPSMKHVRPKQNSGETAPTYLLTYLPNSRLKNHVVPLQSTSHKHLHPLPFTNSIKKKAICHCKVCKKLSSSLFALHYPIPPSNFSITPTTSTTGEESGDSTSRENQHLKTHKFHHPDAPSMAIEAAFCDSCGTWLYKKVDAEPFAGWFLVQGGTVGDLKGDGGGDEGDGESGEGKGDEGEGEIKGEYWDENKPVVELWVSQRVKWLGAVEGAEQREGF